MLQLLLAGQSPYCTQILYSMPFSLVRRAGTSRATTSIETAFGRFGGMAPSRCAKLPFGTAIRGGNGALPTSCRSVLVE
jgi:hypothetical protein